MLFFMARANVCVATVFELHLPGGQRHALIKVARAFTHRHDHVVAFMQFCWFAYALRLFRFIVSHVKFMTQRLLK